MYKFKFLQKLYFHGNLWENISQSTVLVNSLVVQQSVVELSTVYFARSFTWRHPCLYFLDWITAVTRWKISCSWVHATPGTGVVGRYQVLQIPDRKAFNMPSEAELCLRIAKKRQELPSLLLGLSVLNKKQSRLIEQHPKLEKNLENAS